MATPFEQFRPDPAGPAPLYLQLVQRIAAAIDAGSLDHGEALPPERQLCAALAVSRVTLRRAIEVLSARGLIVSRHGSGTFIAKRVVQPLLLLSSFSQDMQDRGWRPGQRLLSRTIHPADAEEEAALALPPGEPVLRLVRLRLADDLPLAIERACVPARFLPTPDAIGSSLYATLAAHGLPPVRATQRLRAAAAEPGDAPHLEIAVGSPVMRTQRHSFLADGRAVEFTRSVFRGDRYEFVTELK